MNIPLMLVCNVYFFPLEETIPSRVVIHSEQRFVIQEIRVQIAIWSDGFLSLWTRVKEKSQLMKYVVGRL